MLKPLRLLFWYDGYIKEYFGDDLGVIRYKLKLDGFVVPDFHCENRKRLRNYLEVFTDNPVSLSREDLPVIRFWTEKGFRSFKFYDTEIARMVKVTVALARVFRDNGSIADNYSAVRFFRARNTKLDLYSDRNLLDRLESLAYAESANNVFLVSAMVTSFDKLKG